MRISDWSSDVFASDLPDVENDLLRADARPRYPDDHGVAPRDPHCVRDPGPVVLVRCGRRYDDYESVGRDQIARKLGRQDRELAAEFQPRGPNDSEETGRGSLRERGCSVGDISV